MKTQRFIVAGAGVGVFFLLKKKSLFEKKKAEEVGEELPKSEYSPTFANDSDNSAEIPEDPKE